MSRKKLGGSGKFIKKRQHVQNKNIFYPYEKHIKVKKGTHGSFIVYHY